MKRKGNIYEQVWSIDNLRTALHNAQKGKKKQRSVIRFMKKEDALKRLDSIEAEQKELRRIIEAPDVIDIFSVTTMEGVFKAMGSSLAAITGEGDTIDEIAYKKWKLIKKFFCGDWEEDWENSNQYKYYPYFKKTGGRFCFPVWTYGSDVSAHAGSRFVFPNSVIAIHVGKYFKKEYNELATISV